ncbi:MAG: SUMF1/EgtB/PvdO family nonheme iron enzyme, partial [Pseudomonadota bacterium]
MTRLTGGSKSLCLFLAAVMITACGSDPAPPQEQAFACGLATQKIGAFVAIPAGDFVKGANALYPEERPEIRLNVPGFQIQAHEVTNGQFAAFVSATGYITEAERSVTDRDIGAGSAVFSSLIDGEDVGAVWSLMPGATWR